MTSDELVAKIFVEDLPTITSVDCGTQISRLSRRFLTLHARDTPANSRWSFFAAGLAAQLQFHGELSNTGEQGLTWNDEAGNKSASVRVNFFPSSL